MTINCQNTDAVNLGTVENPDFEYQNLVCESTGFTDGSLVISFFLFLIIPLVLVAFFNAKFLGIRITRSRNR